MKSHFAISSSPILLPAVYSNNPQYSMIALCGFSEKNLGNWVSSNK
jgi:hypothetical protein